MKKKIETNKDNLVEVSQDEFKKFLIKKFKELRISGILYSHELGDLIIFDDEIGHERVLEIAKMEININNERKKIIVQNAINEELNDLKKIRIPKYVE